VVLLNNYQQYFRCFVKVTRVPVYSLVKRRFVNKFNIYEEQHVGENSMMQIETERHYVGS